MSQEYEYVITPAGVSRLRRANLPVQQVSMHLTVEIAAQLHERLHSGEVEQLVAEGLDRLYAAIATSKRGERLDDETAIRLGLDLRVIRIRDEAVAALASVADLVSHVRLWADLTQRLEEKCLPPIVSLCAMAAIVTEQPDLAYTAVTRALAIDPNYSLAVLLRSGLLRGLSLSRVFECAPSSAELDSAIGPPHRTWFAALHRLLLYYANASGDAAKCTWSPGW